ncbi:Aldose 1-epimerase [Raoultella terrigena]|uniref:Aldose 1-epimerase n=1 Tax=Raoultella terrigena TaxID=577 RepID=A0A4U9DBU8_RAOTE|nr:Aldose 1-epimerase [Raoultella terrigena]
MAETSFDFREPQLLAERFLSDDDQRKVKGYDHAFLLQAQGDAGQPAAHLWSQDEKLQMTVYTSAPALQFYSGNYLGGTPSRTEQPYADWQGLALESEFLPDSPNHPHWPQPDWRIAPGRGVRQPDGIPVYRQIIPPALLMEGFFSPLWRKLRHLQTKI